MTESIEPVEATDTVLRLLSYNVRSLRDDPAAVAWVIRSAAPHVVCIQEAPRLWRWRSACAALARRAGLLVVTGGGTAAGNLILCNLAVEVVVVRDELFSPDRGLHRRGAAVAVLRWRGRDFAVAGTHLDLEPAARLRHIGELHRALATLATDSGIAAGASVIAADVNDEPGSPAWAALTEARPDAFWLAGAGTGFTFTAGNPRRRIDGVFSGPGLTPVSAAVLDGPEVQRGSDHRPVLVELRMGGSD